MIGNINVPARIDYVVHACDSRMWYVKDFLVPDMKKQGISFVYIYNDILHKGNLFSTMDCFKNLYYDGFTWHLQDDVLISGTFKERSDSVDYRYPVVCGFCSEYDEMYAEEVTPKLMWYSFPCIRIENKVAIECADWFYSEAIHMDKYKEYVQRKKYDDSFFKDFIEYYYRDIKIFNVAPNLVEHIDYMIGGSVANNQRDNVVQSRYWIEYDRVSELQESINRYASRKS